MVWRVLGAAVLSSTAEWSAVAAERNIVVFITDDESPTLVCYGDRVARRRSRPWQPTAHSWKTPSPPATRIAAAAQTSHCCSISNRNHGIHQPVAVSPRGDIDRTVPSPDHVGPGLLEGDAAGTAPEALLSSSPATNAAGVIHLRPACGWLAG
jgi:hypothetical protein